MTVETAERVRGWSRITRPIPVICAEVDAFRASIDVTESALVRLLFSGMQAQSQRGAALILALIVLGFLTILGSALLTTTTIDVRIANNYRTGSQALYLAEAGLDEARRRLAQYASAGDALIYAAGPDNTISTSRDLTILLGSDDQPLIPSAASGRQGGAKFTDLSGRSVGRYWVWLHNDVAEGTSTVTDDNEVLHLLAFAVAGDARKIMEFTVKKGKLPELPAALTLNGEMEIVGCTPGADLGCFEAAQSGFFEVDGRDGGAAGADRNSVGVISTASRDVVLDAIPDNLQPDYRGLGTLDIDPPPADVAVIGEEMDALFVTVSGLETLVSRIATTADAVHQPLYGNTTRIGDYGSSTDYKIAVVNGDCTLGPGTGYGTLVVRGVLSFNGNFTWNGLVLVIGQGRIHWNASANGSLNGALFVARTRDDRSPDDLLGSLRATRGPVHADFSGAGGRVQYDTSMIAKANSSLPYTSISFREF